MATIPKAEIVVFNARFCGGKKIAREKCERNSTDFTDENLDIKPVESKTDVFNIKRARYEVIRYGMSGFDKEQQTNSKIAMAIRLGAKPPKKKHVNYKILMEEKMKEKEALKKDRASHYNLQQLKQRKKSGKKKKLKNQPNSLV